MQNRAFFRSIIKKVSVMWLFLDRIQFMVQGNVLVDLILFVGREQGNMASYMRRIKLWGS